MCDCIALVYREWQVQSKNQKAIEQKKKKIEDERKVNGDISYLLGLFFFIV